MSLSLSVVVEKYLGSKKLSSGTYKEYRATLTSWLVGWLRDRWSFGKQFGTSATN